MISRDVLRELASFQTADQSAVTFYFQPSTPRDQSHRDEAILVRDLVREVQRERERNGHRKAARGDLERITHLAEHLNGNHSRAKAIFACEQQGIWREFDVPARLAKTALLVNRRFHLKPLSTVLEETRRSVVALVDRKRARLFDVVLDEVKPLEDFTDESPRQGKSDGFAGYAAGHVERHAGTFAVRHYQNVNERLLRHHATGNGFEKLLVGCRDEIWPELQPQLHTYLQDAVLGHFVLDVATATPEEVKEKASHLLAAYRAGRREALVREALGQAQRNGRGSLGLRRVLQSLQRGEAQVVLVGENFSAPAVECSHCGHVDSHNVKTCAVCGQPTLELEDVTDALIALALRNRADVLYVGDRPEFAGAGNVAALLRFRADQNTEGKKMAG